MPFANFKDFADCVSKNQGKKNPQAYCASIMRQVEGTKKKPDIVIDNRMRNFGETHVRNGEAETIKLNVKKGNVVDTIIHERLHAENPGMSEREVRERTGKIEGTMPLVEQANLLVQTALEAKGTERGKLNIHRTQTSKVVSRKVRQTP